jgi:hypothetical protein
MRKAAVARSVLAMFIGALGTLLAESTFATESPEGDQPPERDHRAAPWSDLHGAAHAGTTATFGGVVFLARPAWPAACSAPVERWAHCESDSVFSSA